MEISGLHILAAVGVIAAVINVLLYRLTAHRDAPVAPNHWAVARRDRGPLP